MSTPTAINESQYRVWLDKVDEAIQEIYGEGKESLPKIVNFRNMFSQLMLPEDAAQEALKQCNLNIESFEGIFTEE